MTHFNGLAQVKLEQPSTVTIGVFDGVHRGHQALLRGLANEAHAAGRLAVAVTFFPHPDVILRGLTERYYLLTPDERAALLSELGIDHVITLTFDEALRQIRAVEFVNGLLQRLHMQSLWVGADFALGYQREGDVEFLQQQGAERGFALHVIDMVSAEADAISSTRIRELLLTGEVEAARDLLGRAYSVTGEVVHGEARGRKIGFPTANIDVWEQQIIPANGVYAGWALLGEERFMAVTNVGLRPTFNGQGITVEAHLLDFDRDIYGQKLTFTFEKRLRPEMKFDGIQALMAQIAADSQAGRIYLEDQLARNEVQ